MSIQAESKRDIYSHVVFEECIGQNKINVVCLRVHNAKLNIKQRNILEYSMGLYIDTRTNRAFKNYKE